MNKLLLSIFISLFVVAEVRSQTTLPIGIPVNSFSAAALTASNGTTYAVPQGRGVIFTWQTSFAAAPTSITVQLQGSLDNSTFFALDTSTSTAGEIRYFGPSSPRFVRCAITAVTAGAGSALTCTINALQSNNPVAFSGGTFTTDISFSGTSGVKFGGDTRIRRTGTKSLTLDDTAGNAANLSTAGRFEGSDFLSLARTYLFLSRGSLDATSDGVYAFDNNAGTRSLSFQTIDIPSCTANCGTSPSVTGTGSSFTLTMGATGVPASGFVVTFATAWAAAPQCMSSMALTGMVIGKLPLTLVTTTTTITVVTNGTAPSVADKYHFTCSLGQ